MKPYLNFALILRGLFFPAAIAVMASCSSQRVVTNVINRYPSLVGTDDVAVYEKEEDKPEEAILIGLVRVYEDKLTKPVPWETTLKYAKKAVSRNGGNGLLIQEHIYPDYPKSRNHQLSGQILLSKASRKETLDNEKSGFFAPFGSHVYAGLGVGEIISPINYEDGLAIKRGNLSSGLDYELGYKYVSKGGLGIGIISSNYHSEAQATYYSEEGKMGLDINSFILSGVLAAGRRQCFAELSLGMGPFFEKDRFIAIENSFTDTLLNRRKGVASYLGLELDWRPVLGTMIGLRYTHKQHIISNEGTDGMKTGFNNKAFSLTLHHIF